MWALLVSLRVEPILDGLKVGSCKNVRHLPEKKRTLNSEPPGIESSMQRPTRRPTYQMIAKYRALESP